MPTSCRNASARTSVSGSVRSRSPEYRGVVQPRCGGAAHPRLGVVAGQRHEHVGVVGPDLVHGRDAHTGVGVFPAGVGGDSRIPSDKIGTAIEASSSAEILSLHRRGKPMRGGDAFSAAESVNSEIVTASAREQLCAGKKRGREPAPFLSRRHRTARLLDEQHLAVGRQRPQPVRRQRLDRVAGLAQLGHRRHHLVAHVLRVLLGRAAAVLEQRRQRVGLACGSVSTSFV